MTSDEAFVWTWLPGETSPVVAGAVRRTAATHTFTYGQSYLRRSGAINLFGPEVRLERGEQVPEPHLNLHGFLNDALPDGWGQKVIDIERGRQEHSPIEYMLLSGSNRFGAIDFQERPDEFVSRSDSATLDDLHSAAERVEAGLELPAALRDALVHGTSIGGARPKATVMDGGTEYIAKFSSTADSMPVIQAEAASMFLARKSGLRCAPIRIVRSLGKIVLLVERFDRDGLGGRMHAASVLSLMKERAEDGHYLSYPDVVRRIQEYSSEPAAVGPELFERIAFNIAVGNTDDHARNHAVLWDGKNADLTPAYDLAPQPRSGMSARQAMSLGDGFGSTRESSFAALIGESSLYGLTRVQGRESVDAIVTTVEDSFREACDYACLTSDERTRLYGGVSGQFLNEGAFVGLS